MKAIVFNIHDVALLLIAGECSMLAVLFLAHRGAKPVSHYLLAAFLILNALIALDTLIYWGEAVRYRAFDLFPDIFFLFGFAYFLEGPVLYWYTKSLIYKDFSFRASALLHLLPAIAAMGYLYAVYHQFPPEIQRKLVLDFQIFHVPGIHFILFVTLQKSIVVIYGLMCLVQLLRYRAVLKDNYSDIEKIDYAWLKLLIGGFLLAWVWGLVTHLVGWYELVHIGDLMGIFGNYFLFVLINILIFYSLIYSNVFEGVSAYGEQNQPGGKETIDPIHVEKIRSAMETEKLYLNSRLTLEEFSEHVKLSPRQASTAINRCIDQNFHEFVNSFRVEEAKRILADPARREQAVLDVALLAGFNSKATFNRFFKKFAGMTPSQYRQKHLR